MSQFNGIAYTDYLSKIHAQSFVTPWTKESFFSLLKLSTTFGFLEEGAFILCSDLGQDIEILTLAVCPEYRRKGLATKLLKNVQHFAKKHNKQHIFLEVNVQNEAAKSLYIKNGFFQTGVRKNYYHEPQGINDALCFVWNKD